MRELTIRIPNYEPARDNKEVRFLVGKDAKDNDAVIDSGKAGDLWFHLHDESSCHVVACVPEDVYDINDKKKRKGVLRSISKQGAMICKRFSRMKSEKDVTVTCAKLEDVQKTRVPGQVVIVGDSGLVVV